MANGKLRKQNLFWTNKELVFFFNNSTEKNLWKNSWDKFVKTSDEIDRSQDICFWPEINSVEIAVQTLSKSKYILVGAFKNYVDKGGLVWYFLFSINNQDLEDFLKFLGSQFYHFFN